MRVGYFAAVAVSVLAGCGGSGDGEEVVARPPDLDGPDATFSQIRSDFSDKFATYEPLPPTGLSEMPVFGTATYTGSAVYSDRTTDPLAVQANPTRASRMQMTADFSAAEVNGRLYNFRALNPSTVIDGELAMTGIVSGNTFQGGAFGAPGGVSGTLVTNGVPETHGGAFAGNFAGSSAEAVTGVVVHGTPSATFSGVLVGER